MAIFMFSYVLCWVFFFLFSFKKYVSFHGNNYIIDMYDFSNVLRKHLLSDNEWQDVFTNIGV